MIKPFYFVNICTIYIYIYLYLHGYLPFESPCFLHKKSLRYCLMGTGLMCSIQASASGQGGWLGEGAKGGEAIVFWVM